MAVPEGQGGADGQGHLRVSEVLRLVSRGG